MFKVLIIFFTNLNKAFSAPSICTVDDGCLAKLSREPVRKHTQVTTLTTAMKGMSSKTHIDQVKNSTGLNRTRTFQ